MWHWLFIAFLVAHGLVHLAVWLSPVQAADVPFRPDRSWLLGAGHTAHCTSVALAVAAAAAFLAAAVALMLGLAVWQPVTVAASVLGLTMSLLYFNPWLLADVALNAGLLSGLLATEWPPSLAA